MDSNYQPSHSKSTVLSTTSLRLVPTSTYEYCHLISSKIHCHIVFLFTAMFLWEIWPYLEYLITNSPFHYNGDTAIRLDWNVKSQKANFPVRLTRNLLENDIKPDGVVAQIILLNKFQPDLSLVMNSQSQGGNVTTVQLFIILTSVFWHFLSSIFFFLSWWFYRFFFSFFTIKSEGNCEEKGHERASEELFIIISIPC